MKTLNRQQNLYSKTKTTMKQAIDSLNVVSKPVEQLKAKTLSLSKQLPEYPVVMAMRG